MFVEVADLPGPERLAFLERELGELSLPLGQYDDAAHAAYAAASPAKRARAEQKAAIARDLLAMVNQGVTECERRAIIRKKHGANGTSKTALHGLLRAVKGVDPINFAPVLLDGYRATKARAAMSEDAWRTFMTLIRDAAPDWPLKQAWRDVRDIGAAKGWDVPSYPTFYRRWTALLEAGRLDTRQGTAATVKALAQPALRDKTSIGALEWVSLDGRQQDFWVDWGDGRALRPVMLALVDVASNVVLDLELAPSENAAGTVQIIKRTCARFGIFDRLYTDNASAFAGHLVAGGNAHRFRNGVSKHRVKPLGICAILAIDLRFALPRHAQAKIAERTFATLSRAIDDRSEFKGAHAGHAPGAIPSANVAPVPVDTARAVISREVARHNNEPGRRSQGAMGRSYQTVFEDSLARRIIRTPTQRPLHPSGLLWKPVAVDRFGRVRINGWAYGGPETIQELLPFHGRGQHVLFGRDPYDFDASAIAYDEAGNLICEGNAPVKRGAYGSVGGIRDAARNRKAARAAAEQARIANNYLDDAQLQEALRYLDGTERGPKPQSGTVVEGRFGAPLRDKAPAEGGKTASDTGIPEEYLRNLDKAIRKKTLADMTVERRLMARGRLPVRLSRAVQQGVQPLLSFRTGPVKVERAYVEHTCTYNRNRIAKA